MGFEGLKGRWWGDEDYFFCVCPHACCACEGKECDEDLSSHRMNRGRIDTTACCESACGCGSFKERAEDCRAGEGGVLFVSNAHCQDLLCVGSLGFTPSQGSAI